jgi:hypothetical protein
MHMKRARSRKQVYSSRIKRSHCRGRTGSRCSRKFGCVKARGTKRRFCRKSSNRKIRYVREASLIY